MLGPRMMPARCLRSIKVGNFQQRIKLTISLRKAEDSIPGLFSCRES